MKYFSVLSAGVMCVTLVGSASAASYTIDPAHTYPHFAISHLGFSTMHGRFNKTMGKLDIDLEKKTGAVDITIDAASVDTGFPKRDDHLRTPDFFNVAEFPEIKYKSTKVTITSESAATVEGNLTIAGVTKPVTLTVDAIKCGDHPMPQMKGKFVCGFNATGNLKRSDFGVKYGLPAVGDDVKLTLEVEALKD